MERQQQGGLPQQALPGLQGALLQRRNLRIDLRVALLRDALDQLRELHESRREIRGRGAPGGTAHHARTDAFLHRAELFQRAARFPGGE